MPREGRGEIIMLLNRYWFLHQAFSFNEVLDHLFGNEDPYSMTDEEVRAVLRKAVGQ